MSIHLDLRTTTNLEHNGKTTESDQRTCCPRVRQLADHSHAFALERRLLALLSFASFALWLRGLHCRFHYDYTRENRGRIYVLLGGATHIRACSFFENLKKNLVVRCMR